MTMGPEPMIRIEWMSVRLGIGSMVRAPSGARGARPGQNPTQCTGVQAAFQKAAPSDKARGNFPLPVLREREGAPGAGHCFTRLPVGRAGGADYNPPAWRWSCF